LVEFQHEGEGLVVPLRAFFVGKSQALVYQGKVKACGNGFLEAV